MLPPSQGASARVAAENVPERSEEAFCSAPSEHYLTRFTEKPIAHYILIILKVILSFTCACGARGEHAAHYGGAEHKGTHE